jgi:hypothetical protein
MRKLFLNSNFDVVNLLRRNVVRLTGVCSKEQKAGAKKIYGSAPRSSPSALRYLLPRPFLKKGDSLCEDKKIS